MYEVRSSIIPYVKCSLAV